MTRYVAAAVLAAGVLLSTTVSSQDRHTGYYYPEPGTEETYQARARTLPESDRDRRLGFVVAFMGEMARDPAPQRFAIFAKGGEAEKLIIVALDDEVFATLFSRPRGSGDADIPRPGIPALCRARCPEPVHVL